MAFDTSFYLDTLSRVIVSTIAFILGLAASFLIPYLVWRLSKVHIVRLIYKIEDAAGVQRTQDKLNDGWYFVLALVFGLIVGGYLAGVVIFIDKSDSLLDASLKSATAVAGASIGVAVSASVIVLLGKAVGLLL